MIRRLPPLGALRAFEAAARLGSFSAAADELHVTHGAVSRQVRGLESWLGIEVFRRVGKRVYLTDGGRDYLTEVQAAFDRIATATVRLKESGDPRRLTVNSLPTLTMRWLLPRLTRFQRLHPGVELRLTTSESPVSSLDESFEVALRRGPDNWPGCVSQEFLVEYELPVCSPALLENTPLKTVQDLAHHTLLHADTRPDAWPRWLAAAGAPQLRSQGRQQFDRFYLALQAAVDGLGVVLGPLPILEEDLAAGRLVAPLAGPAVPSRSYWWVVPRHRAGDPLVTAFCRWLSEEASANR